MSASSTLPARLAPSSRSMRLGVTLKRSEKKRSGRLCVISVIDSPDWPFGASNPNAPLTPPQVFQTSVHCIETGKHDRCETLMMIQPGDAAPDFSLPAVHREGTVSLSDYRGRSPVLLALFRGFYCPFCRRQMSQLATAADKLKVQGLDVLGVAAADPDRARLYVAARPLRLPMGADPALTTYRAYGLGQVARTPDAGVMVEAAASRWAQQLAIPFTAG